DRSSRVHKHGVFEQVFTASTDYGNPLKDVNVAVEFSGPGAVNDEVNDEVNAFWDGGRTWKVRYSPRRPGSFTWKVTSSDKALNAQRGKFQVHEYKGSNALYRNGGPGLSFNRRYLVQDDSKPWFFLSDTAWNGALKSTDDEWKRYLDDRAAKKFTAVQFVMTQWRAGRQDEKGQVAFTGNDPIRINPEFFQRMDRKIQAVNDSGLVAAPVMLWALASQDKESPGVGLPTEQAALLARYMAARYAGHKVIWILGGDGDYSGPENEAKWKQIGRTVFPKDRKRQLVGVHPRGMQSPWKAYIEEPWLDIFFYQSGHGSDAKKWRWNATQGPAAGWKLEPAHPVIDAEPNYEAHLSYQGRRKISDYDVRRAAYYSLLAAPPAGVSYGAHGIWFWSRKAEVPLDHPRTGVADPWHVCLDYPGANQMKVLYDSFNSIEWWRLRPERYLLREDRYNEETFSNYMMSAVTGENDLGMIYMPDNPEVTLNLSYFRSKVEGTWVDPRTGKRTNAGTWDEQPDLKLKRPGDGDWVLILRKV
ncbi:MAG: DUF4038 domain-containing protein, partial [Bryobacteraceae bacterium]